MVFRILCKPIDWGRQPSQTKPCLASLEPLELYLAAGPLLQQTGAPKEAPVTTTWLARDGLAITTTGWLDQATNIFNDAILDHHFHLHLLDQIVAFAEVKKALQLTLVNLLVHL